ncbi:protein CHROMATIN REMODELING 8 [Vigna unguiculata]|uniref:DNA excision repair protein ERCC-6 n=1 Tax=Vigna unguiculata TaxID=3917 RepID=A0A4D6N3W1_VIGUN|nr:protein CHROMATIN REMODELING 8 [Vigna unguiculata]QCE06707.1 DNA excision repair protein ERCC-6 [Vigna unguiculata]
MEEEEDRILLCSLGVKSANPEDIERDVLEKVTKNDSVTVTEAEGSAEEECSDLRENVDPSANPKAELHQKLRTVQFEIDAVASTVGRLRNVENNEECSNAGEEDLVSGIAEVDSSNNSNLQCALSADRLRSLRKTKAQLEKELLNLSKDDASKSVEDGQLIFSLAREERKPKRKVKEDKKSDKGKGKRLKKVSFDDDVDFDTVLDAASAGFVETERDELVRKGILTPFHKLKGFERRFEQLETSTSHNAAEEENASDLAAASVERAAKSMYEAARSRPTTKLLEPQDAPKLDAPTFPFRRLRKPLQSSKPLDREMELNKDSKRKKRRPLPGRKWTKRVSCEDTRMEESENGDGCLDSSSFENLEEQGIELDDHESYVTLEGGLKIPVKIFEALFEYQKVGVQWLWELHCQRAGGIIGDEMGLGKTVQVLSFLGALHYSGMYKPSIIVCPVTLLRQWKREANKWYPKFLVELLHESAEDSAPRKKRAKSEETDCETNSSSDNDYEKGVPPSRNTRNWESLINRVMRSESGLLITTYEQLRILGDQLLDIQWGYAVLDEGHKIRNPNAEVTLVCKQLQTVHRIIMTGAPIQNKLTELWSLFDFVFPGKLGVLPVFEVEFAVPIAVGGYANASPLQVSTAYRCAVVLRDLIMPYLLRRMKADVNAQLPKKTEHVLFCSLTPEQVSAYRAFLASTDVEQILDGHRNSLYGIDVMRKICNHPDLLERDHAFSDPDYGNPERSGKMKVVGQVLNVWKEQGHRVLLFTQTQQMLDIFENFLTSSGHVYRRMDGLTPVKQRMALIDEFNASSEIFIFILTTRVGGLGTNLTGADRVIIFDPDWNPSNDMQARERAWRIGQKRDVTVYRLITRGTIEEKVYHRQIYKHFLTNKILKNPQQKRFFKARDMKDLFVLNVDGETGSTETSNIFSQISEQVNVIGTQKENKDKNEHSQTARLDSEDVVVNNDDKSERGSPEGKGKEKVEHNNGVDDGTDILKSLFDANGIHSAVNHDLIMNAHDEEKMRLEEQASQVAGRAAEALRQSRMLRSHDSVSVPTWTGRSGTAGAPSSVRRKFGSTVNPLLVNKSKGTTKLNGFAAGASAGKALSSVELLAQIRGNQEKAIGAGLEHQSSMLSSSTNQARSLDVRSSRATASSSGLQPEVLIRQICTFIQQRGGSSDSASIVQYFKERIPSQDLALFKNLLKEIATLHKGSNGSHWVLKPDYQF